MLSTPTVQLVAAFKLLGESLIHPGRALKIDVDPDTGKVKVVPEAKANAADEQPDEVTA